MQHHCIISYHFTSTSLIGFDVDFLGEFRIPNNVLDVGFFDLGVDRCGDIAGIFDVDEGRIDHHFPALDLIDGCILERQVCKKGWDGRGNIM